MPLDRLYLFFNKPHQSLIGHNHLDERLQPALLAKLQRWNIYLLCEQTKDWQGELQLSLLNPLPHIQTPANREVRRCMRIGPPPMTGSQLKQRYRES